MGRKCCVKGCSTMYQTLLRQANGTTIGRSVFRFPTDPERCKEWLHRIGKNKDMKTQHLGVCSLHFEDEFIKTHRADNGTELRRLRLHHSAIPTLFLPMELGEYVDSFIHSSTPQHKLQIEDTRSLATVDTIQDGITSFDNLQEQLREKLNLENWIVVTTSHNLYIFNLNKKLSGNLSIRNTISVDVNLIVKVFNDVDDNLLLNMKLYRWSQLQKLIDQLSDVSNDLNFDNFGSVTKIERNVIESVDVENCTTKTTSDPLQISTMPTAVPLVGVTTSKEFAKPLSAEFSDGPYICTECGKEFDQNARLMIHMKVHQPQVCSICTEGFTGTLNRHMEQFHLPKKTYECYICNPSKTYSCKTSLDSHIELNHMPTGQFYCDICDDSKNHKTIKLIRFHMRKHASGELPPIPRKPEAIENFQLQFVLAKQEELRKKKSIVRDNSEKDANDPDVKKCTKCDKEFPTPKQYKQHMQRHDLKLHKPCPICGKRFFGGVSRHIKQRHSEIRNHICDICGAAYKDNTLLKDHVIMKHTPEGEFFCEICSNGRIFRARAHLRKHLITVHAAATVAKEISVNFMKVRSYTCQQCNKQFPTLFKLNSHTASKHNDGTMAHQCKICYKKFGLKSLLVAHEKIHSEKSLVCHECGQAFKHPSYLRKHINRHNGLNRKECKICQKVYANNVDLRIHMKKVHGVVVERNLQSVGQM